MMRVLFNLLDGITLRYLKRRAALTLIGLVMGSIGLGFLIATIYQAAALGVGDLYAALICGGIFVIFALGLFAIANRQWRRRPRPLLARARYGAATELLTMAQTLIREDPAKAVIAALILGAMTEHLQKRSAAKRAQTRE